MAAFIAVRDTATAMVTIGVASRLFGFPEPEWQLLRGFRTSQWSQDEKKFGFSADAGTEVVTLLRQRGHQVFTEEAGARAQVRMPECRVCAQVYPVGTVNDQRICVGKDAPEHVMVLVEPHACGAECAARASQKRGAA